MKAICYPWSSLLGPLYVLRKLVKPLQKRRFLWLPKKTELQVHYGRNRLNLHYMFNRLKIWSPSYHRLYPLFWCQVQVYNESVTRFFNVTYCIIFCEPTLFHAAKHGHFSCIQYSHSPSGNCCRQQFGAEINSLVVSTTG